MKKLGMFCLALMLMGSCKNDPNNAFSVKPEDYNPYLTNTNKESLTEAIAQKEFWSKRMRPDSSGVGDLAPLAGAYELLFETTGNVEHLLAAEQLYRKGVEHAANNKDAFARGLAHNLISQHRFKEAYQLLGETLEGPSNKHQTRLMLFDAAMEVGEYEKAYEYLTEVKNLSDYNYLIRASKWSDYRGDLDSAIDLMEKARDVAESRNSKPLKIWTYSNLGDYYGHAGRIGDAYNAYLKTLELQPDNAYAKKGLAWIAYAHDGDITEAHRILDSIEVDHTVPDYHLLRSELYSMEGNHSMAKIYEDKFISEVTQKNYGAMYNAYLIELWSQSEPSKALARAQEEVTRRATPETFHLLALAQLNNGDAQTALQTIETHVAGKTYEPMAAYHSALVYKANQNMEQVALLKAELLEAAFELGPALFKEVEAL